MDGGVPQLRSADLEAVLVGQRVSSVPCVDLVAAAPGQRDAADRGCGVGTLSVFDSVLGLFRPF